MVSKEQYIDGYRLFVLRLVAYLRRTGYSIGVGAVENFFKLLPDMDIFDFEETVMLMRGLFAKNPEQYANFRTHIRAYIEKEVSESAKEMYEGYKESLQKLLEEKRDAPPEGMTLDAVLTRATKSEKAIEEQKEEKLSLMGEMAKGHEGIQPFLELDKEGMYECLTDKGYKLEDVRKELTAVMMEWLDKDDSDKVNEICQVSGERTVKMVKKIQDKVKAREKELEVISDKVRDIEKAMSEQNRGQYRGGKNSVRVMEEVLNKDMAEMTQEEYVQLVRYIRQNANKFKTRMSRTMKRAKRRELDFKRTIRESVKTQGDAIELYYKKPMKKKTRLVCILDISGSVINHAKIFLNFLHELSTVFTGGTRSYVFVREIAEVTEYLTRWEITEGIEKAMGVIPVKGAYSDYNYALKSYNERYLNYVDSSTIVLFLGDARNNRNPKGLEYMETIRKKAKTVVWLNPERKADWGTGDSIMWDYAKCVDSVYQTATVRELVDFLEELRVG